MTLQTSSCGPGPGCYGGSLAQIRSRLFATQDNTAMYNNDTYVQALNGILRQELAAVSCYGKFLGACFFEADAFCDDHRHAGRQIERLIIANRGIPTKRAASPASSVNRAILEFCRAIPGESLNGLVRSQFGQFECQLRHRYDSILKNAPIGDAEILRDLRAKCEKRSDSLLKI